MVNAMSPMAVLVPGAEPVTGFYDVELWSLDEDDEPEQLVIRRQTLEPEITLTSDDGLDRGREYAVFVRFIGSGHSGPKMSDRIRVRENFKLP